MFKRHSLHIQVARNLLLSMISLQLSFTPGAFGVEVELTQARNLRSSADQNLEVVGRLAAGSLIDIPDDYAVFENGKLNFDKSVQKWLKALKDKEGKRPVFANFDGKKHDYFIPIKVLQAAGGSRVSTTDQEFMISIRDVGVEKDPATHQAQMQTTHDANLLAKKPTNTAFEANCSGPCDAAMGTTSAIAKTGKEITKKASDQAKVASGQATDAATRRFNQISDEFLKTCHMDLFQFATWMQGETQGTPFKPEEFLAIMGQESKGECFPAAAANPMKHGLFGIQDHSKIPENNCTPQQEKAIRAIVNSNSNVFEQLKDYANNPKVDCVGNPFLNFKASERILASKSGYIRYPKKDTNGKYTEQTMKNMYFFYNGNKHYQANYVRIVAPLEQVLAKAMAEKQNPVASND